MEGSVNFKRFSKSLLQKMSLERSKVYGDSLDYKEIRIEKDPSFVFENSGKIIERSVSRQISIGECWGCLQNDPTERIFRKEKHCLRYMNGHEPGIFGFSGVIVSEHTYDAKFENADPDLLLEEDSGSTSELLGVGKIRKTIILEVILMLAFFRRLIDVLLVEKSLIVFGKSGRILEMPISWLILAVGC